MISLDMKYTALYWALGFVEKEDDLFVKQYGGCEVAIYAEKQLVDYGKAVRSLGCATRNLTRHKDFVILECIDRLLTKGLAPTQIVLDGRKCQADILVNDIKIKCFQWGEDYLAAAEGEYENNTVLYTSRLASGLLEYKNMIYRQNSRYDNGFFENLNGDGIMRPYASKVSTIEVTADAEDFIVQEDRLIRYKGESKCVRVPEGIRSIAASAFWNNLYIERVILPQSLEELGGDCFYYCTNLRQVNIPEKVKAMGNNPFAGCPKLELVCESPHYVLSEGVLFDCDRSKLIYYPISCSREEYNIPQGIKCIGKHSFFACDNLKKITVPESVIKMENNPFSGCSNLAVDNYSEYYRFEDGIIYNKFVTSVSGCLNSTKAEVLILPDSVRFINRNAFWNCKYIKRIIIGKNVEKIGYNPFAGCENMLMDCYSPCFCEEKHILFDKDKKALLCATDRAVGEEYFVPSGVVNINRGAFSGCKRLKRINLNEVQYIDKSAFTNCISLEKIYIPNSVKYIGEWAFAYCKNLKEVSVGRNTKVDLNAFNGCEVNVIRREI